jgi:hypothetical protein
MARRLPGIRQPPNFPQPSQLLFEALTVTLISTVVGIQDVRPPATAGSYRQPGCVVAEGDSVTGHSICSVVSVSSSMNAANR